MGETITYRLGGESSALTVGKADKPRASRLNADLDVQILESAAALLAELGYDGMSIEAVAARAGVGKATIYRRWAGKAELVLSAVRAKGFPVDDTPDTGTVRGDLLAVLGNLQQRLDDEGLAYIAGVLVAMRQHPELTALVHEQLVTVWAGSTQEIVSRAVARGEVAPLSASSFELFSQIAPSLLSLRVLASMGPVDSAFMEHLVDEVLLAMLRPTGAPTPPDGEGIGR